MSSGYPIRIIRGVVRKERGFIYAPHYAHELALLIRAQFGYEYLMLYKRERRRARNAKRDRPELVEFVAGKPTRFRKIYSQIVDNGYTGTVATWRRDAFREYWGYEYLMLYKRNRRRAAAAQED